MQLPTRPRKTVLLVEADRPLARVIRNALQEEHYVVTYLNTGQEALELLQIQYPDAIVLDPDLPDGTGNALVERSRQVQSCAGLYFVIVITSTVDLAEAIRRYGPPIRNFLAKPFDPWDLVGLLNRELANR